jgi:hypothetical protein
VIKTMPVWCLVEDELVTFEYSDLAFGGHYECPYCGVLNTQDKGNDHVFNPFPKLLSRLEELMQLRGFVTVVRGADKNDNDLGEFSDHVGLALATLDTGR